MEEFLHHVVPRVDTAAFVSSTVVRLILAAFLGGAIGLERELHRKPAGLRTNMFICFGSAMFTVLSVALAGEYTGDHTSVAAQIIPGIGFIGAGSILHSRGSVQGLTTAATLFVVAAVGMAAGGGLYMTALFATLVILLALEVLGWTEGYFNLKSLVINYEVEGEQAEEMISTVNGILEDERRIMQSVQVGRSNAHFRVQFSVEGTRREHELLLKRLRSSIIFQKVTSLGTVAPAE